ncbi:hypothetical protein HHUSO_G20894 [Huso huso]|uniref:KASH5-like coiled-coil domain-containing protein n=1 Tax=Huso huso TaxID=61971 RepID=A0ABR0Z283_HUSHU
MPFFQEQERRRENGSDLKRVGKSDAIAELVHSKRRLSVENEELHKTVEMSDSTNTHLLEENVALKSQIKRIQHTMAQAASIREELEEIRGALKKKKIMNTKLEMVIKQLEKKNEMLTGKINSLTDEEGKMFLQRQADQKKINQLNATVHELEVQLEELKVILLAKEELVAKNDCTIAQLNCSLDEYTTVTQDLRQKLKSLQDLLGDTQQEAVLQGEGDVFQGVRGTEVSPVLGCYSLEFEIAECEKQIQPENKVIPEKSIWGKELPPVQKLAKMAIPLDDTVGGENSGLAKLPRALYEDRTSLREPSFSYKKSLHQQFERVYHYALPISLVGLSLLCIYSLLLPAFMPASQGECGASTCRLSMWRNFWYFLVPQWGLRHMIPPPV